MAYLVLENGAVFEGRRFGADGDTVGELVFTTGMVGYPETLTDPAYAGRIVMQTFPMVGNYGIIPADIAPTAAVRGYVVREHCETPSNFRCELTLDAYLKQQGVVGLCGIDTRELTCLLRENGTMNACICDEIPADLTALRQYKVPVAPTRRDAAVYPAAGNKRFAVTVVDFGASLGFLRALCEQGCEVTAVPCDTPAAEILAAQPDGVVLSGGAGDPADYSAALPTVGELFGRVPLLGVGLGHQLIALSQGGQTAKLRCGHHGANQPVKTTGSSRMYITSQNHSYTVTELPANALLLFSNANDGTCEGLTYENNCLSVQFEPNEVVYDRFTAMMGGAANA